MEPKGVVRTPAWIQRLAPRVRRPANAPENEDVTTNNLKHERLGKKELGPYAYEDRMPAKLERLLRNEDQIHGNNAPALLIPLLKRILEKCGDIHTAYLCHPGVQYLHKIKGEGNNFCGYRNMQMLINYLINAGLPGGDFFAGGIPSVLELQDRVEEAWAKGFNAHGRIQTGGVAGTRKHVGTPEVRNLSFQSRYLQDAPSLVWKALVARQIAETRCLLRNRLRHCSAASTSNAASESSKTLGLVFRSQLDTNHLTISSVISSKTTSPLPPATLHGTNQSQSLIAQSRLYTFSVLTIR